jgi:hypothetical protein
MSRLNLILVVFVFLLSGCTVWKSVKNFYRQYVDTDPGIDLQLRGTGNEREEFLARVIYPVDLQLNEVLRWIDVQDTYPDEKWFDETLKAFPWLSGVAAIDRSGQVLFKRPAHQIKPVNYSLLLTSKRVNGRTKVRIAVQDSEFGPEIYLARPFFKDNLAEGMLVIHFDSGSWARLSSSSQEFAIFVGDKPVWAGKHAGLNKYYAQINSTELLKNGVFGQMNMENRLFYWFARAVGENWIIYLMTVDKGE